MANKTCFYCIYKSDKPFKLESVKKGKKTIKVEKFTCSFHNPKILVAKNDFCSNFKANMKKIGKKSKAKGSTFERDIVKFLNDWLEGQVKVDSKFFKKYGIDNLSEEIKKDVAIMLNRSAGSGGLFEKGDIIATISHITTKKNKRGKSIPAITRLGYYDKFPFSIECKNNKSFDLNGIFNDKWILNDFISQAEKDQKDQGKQHLLLFTKLNSKVILWTKQGSKFAKELTKNVTTQIHYKNYVGVVMEELLKIKL